MKLKWTPEAIADRESIYDYIEADNPAAALALDELFSEGSFRESYADCESTVAST